MGWWHHGWILGLGGGEWWMVLVMGLLMLLFWGGVLALLFWVVRAAAGQRGPHQGPGEGALDILARRYAMGEISAEEYQEMKAALQD
ncbi:MAG: SHOCT domain-containing protein [Anaerolineales bacterium]